MPMAKHCVPFVKGNDLSNSKQEKLFEAAMHRPTCQQQINLVNCRSVSWFDLPQFRFASLQPVHIGVMWTSVVAPPFPRQTTGRHFRSSADVEWITHPWYVSKEVEPSCLNEQLRWGTGSEANSDVGNINRIGNTKNTSQVYHLSITAFHPSRVGKSSRGKGEAVISVRW